MEQPLEEISKPKWGTNETTVRTTVLALCYSVADYVAPVWSRSKYANLLDPELNQPIDVEDLYLLVRITPPDNRRGVCQSVAGALNETEIDYVAYY